MTDLSVIVPAFREERRLDRCLSTALDALSGSFEIVVVDDGSPDRTAEIAEAWAHRDPRVQCVRLGRNQGKGAAVREGMLRARGRLRLMTDADLSTPIAEWETLRARIDSGADVAIASRGLPASRLLVRESKGREKLGGWFNRCARIVAVPGIHDTQCGFKLWTARAADAVFPRMRLLRFAFDVESVWRARRAGFRVAEVPLPWTHDERSTVRVFRDGMRMGVDLLSILGFRTGLI